MKASKHTLTVTFYAYVEDGYDITEIESVQLDGEEVSVSDESMRRLDDAVFRLEVEG